MKFIKMLSLVAMSAMALMAFAVSSTSATTLEVNGVTQNKAVEISGSIKAGTSAIIRDTFGFSVNTCTSASAAGTTSTFTGATVTGASSTLSFGGCTNPVTVHNKGTLHVAYTSGTNGLVSSSGAEVTVYSPLHGTYMNCKTGEGTPLGTLTGVAAGQATVDINATINCGPHLSSSKVSATLTITSPNGIGVSKQASADVGSTDQTD